MEIINTDSCSVKILAEGKFKVAGENYIRIYGEYAREHPVMIEVTAKEQQQSFGGNIFDYSIDFRWVRSDGNTIMVWTPQVNS